VPEANETAQFVACYDLTMLRKATLILLVTLVNGVSGVGCATATDDDFGTGGPRKDGGVDSASTDSSTPPVDGTTPVDSGSGTDTRTDPDTGVDEDTGADPDTGDPDTGDPDTGSAPDTSPPFPDIGPGGTCLYCTGPGSKCAKLLEDYTCLLDCIIDGFGGCTYVSGAGTPCTCTP